MRIVYWISPIGAALLLPQRVILQVLALVLLTQPFWGARMLSFSDVMTWIFGSSSRPPWARAMRSPAWFACGIAGVLAERIPRRPSSPS